MAAGDLKGKIDGMAFLFARPEGGFALSVAPELASWDKAGSPGQVRRAAFLANVGSPAGPAIASTDGPVAVELIVGLAPAVPLTSGGRDLDNYLCPLAQHLGAGHIQAMFGHSERHLIRPGHLRRRASAHTGHRAFAAQAATGPTSGNRSPTPSARSSAKTPPGHFTRTTTGSPAWACTTTSTRQSATTSPSTPPGHSPDPRKETAPMTFHLPDALLTDDDQPALRYLRAYYEQRPGTPLGTRITGARFDTWDSTGTRQADTNRFTADDMVAVTFLAVQVHPRAAWELLTGDPDRFNRLLAQVDPSADLADVDPASIGEDWPAWRLWSELRTLRGIDWVIAGKLLARKRPRLIPIYDRIVKTVTGNDRNFWIPLSQELRKDGQALHHRLGRLRQAADLDEAVTRLRVFDIITWMEGKNKGY
jgi:hypothetical protein